MSLRMDWLDLLAVLGTLKSLLQHHSSKASVLQRSAFFTVQLSHPYMTTGKTIALTRRTFVGKVTSLLLNMLSRLVVTYHRLHWAHSVSDNLLIFESVDFCSVAQSRLTLCGSGDCSTPGFPVLHYFLEVPQIHVHRVFDAL